MKTKEELNALKQEAEALSAKCQELTEDEVAEVFGGENFIGLSKVIVGTTMGQPTAEKIGLVCRNVAPIVVGQSDEVIR